MSIAQFRTPAHNIPDRKVMHSHILVLVKGKKKKEKKEAFRGVVCQAFVDAATVNSKCHGSQSIPSPSIAKMVEWLEWVVPRGTAFEILFSSCACGGLDA